jgi:hypothetical protein
MCVCVCVCVCVYILLSYFNLGYFWINRIYSGNGTSVSLVKVGLLCVLCTKCMRRTQNGLVVSVRPSVCPDDSTREPLDGLG